LDLEAMLLVFQTNDANADLNGDGVVDSQDMGILMHMYQFPPGPGRQTF